MPSQEKFSILRNILRALGLSAEATDDIVDRILDFLSDKEEKAPSAKQEYPYLLRDYFLSSAEHNFYLVLRSAVSDWALICPKVALGDLFYVKSSDPSQYRTSTNKIDRKHVDFLLCDPKTVRPLLGIELDDKSHQRSDRQARDEFVQRVFSAANLPLVRIPVRQSYTVSELGELLRQYVDFSKVLSPDPEEKETISSEPFRPFCPQCGSRMVLRTAKSGVNPGERFWGCPNFPRCRGIVKYEQLGVVIK